MRKKSFVSVVGRYANGTGRIQIRGVSEVFVHFKDFVYTYLGGNVDIHFKRPWYPAAEKLRFLHEQKKSD